ncbi:ROK family protein [Euzebya tangerina]|uniref:ROK family protein n=1 Tax=Euzebya tangerina TaxID=591198 RepID=UPI000E317863|nr:ROK family protein [Euzebya tangerina]
MPGNFIGVEAGGTKVVCAVGRDPDDVEEIERIPTTTPDTTLGLVAGYIERQAAVRPIAGVGVASFGPLDLVPSSATYGHLTTTPKPGWQGADLLGPLSHVTSAPVALDTDVNGAALGELRWGAGVGLDSLAYVTVGTGIGVGLITGGRTVTGLAHPEGGHLLVRRHPSDPLEGRCPIHGDCLEGLAAGPAWMDRWGVTSSEMSAAQLEQALDIQAYYLGQLVMTLVLVASPERIVMGGGVLAADGLLDRVRQSATTVLNGYVSVPSVMARPEGEAMAEYLVPPGLGDRAGVLGAIALAQDLVE